jgi:hypothetical protein
MASSASGAPRIPHAGGLSNGSWTIVLNVGNYLASIAYTRIFFLKNTLYFAAIPATTSAGEFLRPR